MNTFFSRILVFLYQQLRNINKSHFHKILYSTDALPMHYWFPNSICWKCTLFSLNTKLKAKKFK